MNIVGKDTEVVSLDGDIVTFEEHCQRWQYVKCCVKEQGLVELELELAWSAY